MIVDAQIHVWQADTPARPWLRTYGRGSELEAAVRAERSRHPATVEVVLAAMDETGVAGALLVTPALYGYDNSYTIEAVQQHPGRFRGVALVDPTAVDMEARIQALSADPHIAGVRLMVHTGPRQREWEAGAYDRFLDALNAAHLPLVLYPPRYLGGIRDRLAARPNLPVIVDHLGLPMPPMIHQAEDPFAGLPDLLDLAELENVAIKLSSLPLLAREPFPYADLSPVVDAVLSSYGAQRVMWGSDFTSRADQSYRETVEYISGSASIPSDDKALLLGGSLQRIFGWTLNRGSAVAATSPGPTP